MRSALFTMELAILASLLSDEILVEDHVLVLNAVNFDEILSSVEYLFVAFYSQGGKPVSPEFAKAATELYREKSAIELGKLEVTQVPEIAEIFGVKKFPSYLLFRTPGRISYYMGELKASLMVYWLKKKTSPPEFVEVRSEVQLKKVIAMEPGALIGFFPDRETRKARAFIQASAVDDNTIYAVVSDPALMWMVKMTGDRVISTGAKSILSPLASTDVEFDYHEDFEDPPDVNERVMTEFPFLLPNNLDHGELLDINTVPREVLRIEHNERTSIEFVGLQVWPSSLLLADLLVYLGLQGELTGKTVLEIGGGTGIASIVACMFAKKVICSDKDVDIIFKLQELNFKHNSRVIKGRIVSVAMDLTKPWTTRVARLVQEVDVVIASDVVYDEPVTKGLISTISKLLRRRPRAVLYFALEDRDLSEFVDSRLTAFMSTLQEAVSEQGACVLAVDKMHHETIPQFFFTYERSPDMNQYKMYCQS